MDHAGAGDRPAARHGIPVLLLRVTTARCSFHHHPGIIVIFVHPAGPERGQTGVRPGSDQGQTGVRPGSDRGQTPGLWNLGRRFYLAMTVILLFSLGNASDAFLLLRISDLGVTAVWIPLLWSAFTSSRLVVARRRGTVGPVRPPRSDCTRLVMVCPRVCRLWLLRFTRHSHRDLSLVRVVFRTDGGERKSVGC
jgi:hypothetical protein